MKRSTKFGGELPSDEETLLSFKGIGDYTAGAIRSFAFGERAAILDTNVARVLLRVFHRRAATPSTHATKRRLWEISEVLVPRRPRLRLQSGADGFRRDRVRRAEAALPGLSDADDLRAYPWNPEREAKALKVTKEAKAIRRRRIGGSGE